MTKLLLLLLTGLLCAWLLIRLLGRRRDADQTGKPARKRIVSPYAAVSIRGTRAACERSKQLAGERFLNSERPPLPLPGCDATRCDCYFVEHDDRRRGHDRRSPYSPNTGHTGTGVFETERRNGRDRRKNS
jgi:hypothetical protein